MKIARLIGSIWIMTAVLAHGQLNYTAPGLVNIDPSRPFNNDSYSDGAAQIRTLKAAIIDWSNRGHYLDGREIRLFAVDSGVANAVQLSVPFTYTNYDAGMEFTFKAAYNNSGATTLQVLNGNSYPIGAVPIIIGTNALTTGAIVADQFYKTVFDGTNFQLFSGGSGSGSGSNIVLISTNVPPFDTNSVTTYVQTIINSNVTAFTSRVKTPVCLVKSNDTVRSNFTNITNYAAVDPDLSFTMASNATYLVEGNLYFSQTNSINSGFIEIAFSGTNFIFNVQESIDSFVIPKWFLTPQEPYWTNVQQAAFGTDILSTTCKIVAGDFLAGFYTFVHFKGTLFNLNSATNDFSLVWSQANKAAVNLYLKAGSSMTFLKLN